MRPDWLSRQRDAAAAKRALDAANNEAEDVLARMTDEELANLERERAYRAQARKVVEVADDDWKELPPDDQRRND